MSFSENQCKNIHFDPDTLITDLPGNLMLKLRDCLDSNPPTSNWRAFLSILSNQYPQYRFSTHEVESMFGCQIYRGSPSNKLFTSLGGRGMTAPELVYVLDKLQLEKILTEIKKYEPIDITEQPAVRLRIKEGETIRLEVKATGFPYPRYQWFKEVGDEFDEIPGACDKVLRITDSRLSHGGTYCCRLHNGNKSHQICFSGYATIIVDVIKKPVHESEIVYPREFDQGSWEPEKPSKGPPDDLAKARLPYIIEQPKSTTVIVGQSVTFICQACGQQPITYKWHRNNQLFDQTQDTFYKIALVTLNHAGVYHCVVSNDFGEVVSNPVQLVVNRPVEQPISLDAADIEIISNPKTCITEVGGTCVFRVEARCRKPLTYQWFKDGARIEGAIQPEYRMDNIQNMELQGSYQCMITAVDARPPTQKLSNAASLAINIPRTPEYTASDKVALLIGNFDYRNESILKAPKQDVLKMAEIFRSLNFKVVSLLNLTKEETISAVYEFTHLLGKGVYGVFYFCGHGFEEDGCCYLVPPDAPAGYTVDDCVCADNVLALIQKSEPALICMILDICRIKNKVPSKKDPENPMLELPPRGNTVYCYATSRDMYAFEDENNGILVKYLQKYLHQLKPIKDIFANVQEDIGKKVRHREIQIPEIRSNLLEPRRSLADKILTTGSTQLYLAKTLRWHNAHQKPDKRDIFLEEIRVRVEMEFQSDFSNMLHVIVTVKELGITQEAMAYIMGWPSSVSLTGPILKISTNPMRTKASLQDIQKLQGDLIVSIAVKYVLKVGDEEMSLCKPRINLGLPLVAGLHLWKPRRREAIEQTEAESR